MLTSTQVATQTNDVASCVSGVVQEVSKFWPCRLINPVLHLGAVAASLARRRLFLKAGTSSSAHGESVQQALLSVRRLGPQALVHFPLLPVGVVVIGGLRRMINNSVQGFPSTQVRMRCSCRIDA